MDSLDHILIQLVKLNHNLDLLNQRLDGPRILEQPADNRLKTMLASLRQPPGDHK
jgi:hypothetical protein